MTYQKTPLSLKDSREIQSYKALFYEINSLNFNVELIKTG